MSTEEGSCLLPACDCVGVCRKLGKGRYSGGIPSQSLAYWNDRPCPYCGTKMHIDSVTRRPTRDHMEPRALGGSNSPMNKIVVCGVCNGDKGCRTVEQFYQMLVEFNDNRAAHVARFIADRQVEPPEIEPRAVKDILREVGQEAQAVALRLFGLQIAVCCVTVHGDQVLSCLSPFEADSRESLAVAHQLRWQSSMLEGQARKELRDQLADQDESRIEAAE